MPIRGENVGTAYVRILADGSGLSESVADMLEDGEADFARAGDKDAEAFGDEFSKNLKKRRPTFQKDIEKTFTLEGERIKRITEEMSSNYYKNMEKSILRRTKNGKIGERILGQIRQDFLKGDYDAFGEGFEKLFARLPDLEKAALAEMAREEARFNENTLKNIRIREDAERLAAIRRATYWRETLDEAYRLNSKFDSERLRSITTQQRQIEMLAKAEAQAYRERDKRFNESADRAIAAFKRIERGESNSGENIRDSIRQTIDHIKELSGELKRMPDLGGTDRDRYVRVFEDMEGGLIRVSPRLRRFNGVLDKTAPAIGRAFGKGSRNDFVNFFGSSIQGISSLVFKLPRLAEGISGVVGTFKELRQASGVLTSLGGALRGAAGGGSAFASSLAAGAVAIPLVIVVVGVLVSALSMLLGVLTALASTISFAVVGALGVLAGAMLPVVAGLGVLAAGILSMSDAQKKALKEAIRPFTDEMKELGQIAGKEIFRDAPEQASRLGKVFQGLRPLVRGVAISIREVADGWIKALEGPGFKRFKDEMTKFLPGAVKSLGETFGNIMGGVGGLFLGLIPATERFLGWLNRITEKFADWANSAKGQNEIKNFMDKALESAKSLGNFLGELGGLLGDLLFNDEGKKAGDSMFDGMADAIARFREYIADGKLEKWFKDSKKFGEDLGDAIKGIGKVLDALDSPGFRSFAGFMLKTFSEIAETLENVIGPIADFGDALDKAFDGDWSGAADSVLEAFKGLPMALLDLFTLGFGDEIVGKITGLGSRIKEGFNAIDWSGIGTTIVTGISTGITNAGGFLSSAVTGLFTQIGTLASSIASYIWNIPGVQMMTGLIAGVVSAVVNLGTALLELGGQIVLLIGRGVLQAGKDFTGLVSGVFRAAFEPIKTVAAPVAAYLQTKFSEAFGYVKGKASDFGNYISGKWSGLMTSGKSGASKLGDYLSGKMSSAFSGAKSKASDLGGYVAGRFSGAWNTAGNAIDKVQGFLKSVKGLMNDAAEAARNLADKISKIKPPSLGSIGKALIPGIKTGGLVDAFGLHRVKKMASGGLANFAQNYQIGEAGREAIVPLNRPLGQVDPAVRLLSAFAQGKLGGSNDNSRTVDASGWVIQSPNDSGTVAQEVLDALVAKLN